MSQQERQRPQSQSAGMRPSRFVIKRPSTSTSFTRSRPKTEGFSSAGSGAGRSAAPRANLKARHFYSRKSKRERSLERNSRTNVVAKFAAASVRSKSRAVHVESRRRRPQTVSPNARKRKGAGALSSSTVKAWGKRAVQTARGKFPLQHVAQRSPGSSMFCSAKQNKVTSPFTFISHSFLTVSSGFIVGITGKRDSTFTIITGANVAISW